MRSGSTGRRWSRIFGTDPKTEIDDELAFHVEERVREYIAEGMTPEQARAAAHRRLGDLGDIREECADLLTSERRAHARRVWLNVSWLDFKLGLRMLLKYPGLTLVGGLAMAFAIWIGASTFDLYRKVVDPKLPLEDGDRVVGIQLWDAKAARMRRQLGHDLVAWRDELRTIVDVGAFRTLERNLVTPDGRAEPIEVAEMSASGFDLARVRPIMGRVLEQEDEAPGAPLVAVIGHDVWQRRFDGDPAIIGKTARMGREDATIVGVMPKDFAFPVAQSVWLPLRLNVLEFTRGQGPSLRVFGRLADGASLDEAQAELTALGQRASKDYPQTHEHLRPQVLPYAQSIVRIVLAGQIGLVSVNVVLLLLIVLICGNVGLLMFARATTRESEIVVRSALGASRARIVSQLFAEALVLGAFAAAIGLAAGGLGLRWLLSQVQNGVMEGARFPFWVTPRLNGTTIVYAFLLTVLAAALAGVMPGMKITRGLQARLRETAASGTLGFGGVWTVIIVAQVAVTLAFPVTTLLLKRDMAKVRAMDVAFPASEYLSFRLEMDGARNPSGVLQELANEMPADALRTDFLEQYSNSFAELQRRLASDPKVASVAYGERLPRMYHPYRLVEVDEGGAAPMDPRWPGYRVASDKVDLGYFDAFAQPIIAGRGFRESDIGSDARVAIVNQKFVKMVFGDRNPIGRRIRITGMEEWPEDRSPTGAPLPWLQIIGVVPDMGLAYADETKTAGFYLPARPEDMYPLNVAVRLRRDTNDFVSELRAAAVAADPALRLYDIQPLNQINQTDLEFLQWWFRLLLAVSGLALALSLAGIYAVMSFAVARRTREIGIRIALGASRRGLIISTFKRPLTQVGTGVLAGAVLIVALGAVAQTGGITLVELSGFLLYTLFMMGVCMLASIVPTRRALRIQPTDALKAVD